MSILLAILLSFLVMLVVFFGTIFLGIYISYIFYNIKLVKNLKKLRDEIGNLWEKYGRGFWISFHTSLLFSSFFVGLFLVFSVIEYIKTAPNNQTVVYRVFSDYKDFLSTLILGSAAISALLFSASQSFDSQNILDPAISEKHHFNKDKLFQIDPLVVRFYYLRGAKVALNSAIYSLIGTSIYYCYRLTENNDYKPLGTNIAIKKLLNFEPIKIFTQTTADTAIFFAAFSIFIVVISTFFVLKEHNFRNYYRAIIVAEVFSFFFWLYGYISRILQLFK